MNLPKVDVQAELRALDLCRIAPRDREAAAELIRSGKCKAADEAVHKIRFRDVLDKAMKDDSI